MESLFSDSDPYLRLNSDELCLVNKFKQWVEEEAEFYGRSVSKDDPNLELNSHQLSLVKEFKQWVETDAEFYGRADEDFLVLFLRSCDFDLEYSKKSIQLYYEVRVKYPEWWTNRDLNEPKIHALINIKAACVFLDHHSNFPTVGVVHLSRFGNDPSILCPGLKFFSCGLDMTSRRRNCQLYGAIIIYDFENLPWWMIWKAMWPPFIKSLVNAFLRCMPFKIKSLVLVNAPAITTAMVNILNTFLSEVHRNKIQCCKSWKDISQCVPLELLPFEYGGHAGLAKVHEDAAVDEILAMNDYFVDDNKYGFQFK